MTNEITDEMAFDLFCHFCPGIRFGDDDLEFYREAVAKVAPRLRAQGMREGREIAATIFKRYEFHDSDGWGTKQALEALDARAAELEKEQRNA